MKTYYLERRYFEHGTFSELKREDGSLVAVCVEQPWNNNEPFASCVPEGEYTISPHKSPKFGSVYILESPNLGINKRDGLRDNCLFHAANKPNELQGCIALGTSFGSIANEWCVVNSRLATAEFFEELDGQLARLIIRESRKD